VGVVFITTGSNFEMGWGWNVGVDNGKRDRRQLEGDNSKPLSKRD